MATGQFGTLLEHIHKLAAGRSLPQCTDRQLLDDFTARHDEAAFAALVARHGSMVLRVCRRVLSHEQDAEDAFQATFLVLVRNTRSIRKREALSDWLHGVAYRTAMKAKRTAARRRNHEARLWTRRTDLKSVPPTWDDVQAVLDEEIHGLPEAFRKAFVLCVLEGKSVPEAAAELSVKEGTVSSRLTRARQRLRQQLARRGIELSALLAAMSVAESAGKAAVPALLANAALRSGLLVAAGGTAAGAIPSQVAALAAGVTRAMFLTKAKIAMALLLAVSVLAGTGVVMYQRLAAAQRAKPQAESAKLQAVKEDKTTQAKPQGAEGKDSVAYGGRVLGPAGRPVAGAKLYLTPAWGYLREPYAALECGTTGPDGRFKFTVPKMKFGEQTTVVSAAAANLGVAWKEVPSGGKSGDVTLRLVNDDVPITGQIVDLEAKPVAGATLRVQQINAAPGEDLGPWLEAVKGKKGLSLELEQQYLSRFTIALSPKVTTDADGRFRLTGIGRNRLVIAQLDGPTIVSQELHILTRPGDAALVPDNRGRPEYGEPRMVTTYHGAGFRHVAAPTKPIVGEVRDKDTKKPLAGVTIRSYALASNPIHIVDIIRTTTDAQGRYRLTGMPKGKGNQILAMPDNDQPYVAVRAEAPDSPGLEPVTVDFDLKLGVWIEGKLTDKVTGKPLQGGLEYFALRTDANLPNLHEYAGFDGAVVDRIFSTKEDGTYRAVGLPGPGLVAVWYMDQYLRAPERNDEYGTKETFLHAAPYHITNPINFGALARINPAKGGDSVKRNIILDPGWTFAGTVLGPDGKPLAGTRSFGLSSRLPPWEGMRTAEFAVRGFNPHRPRDVFFQHLEKGLIGVAQPPKENGGSVTVRMEPGAAVIGRLVGTDGQPRANVELDVWFHSKNGYSFEPYHPRKVKTDGDGNFRVQALLPGYKFRLSDDQGQLSFDDKLRFGEMKDLGDVQLKRHDD